VQVLGIIADIAVTAVAIMEAATVNCRHHLLSYPAVFDTYIVTV
jgi:hypothetical protein